MIDFYFWTTPNGYKILTIIQRPAVARAYEIGASINTIPTVTNESKKSC